MSGLLHAIRSAGSVVIEVVSGGDWKAKLPQHESEHVATWEISPAEVRHRLAEMGYEYQPFAARKFLDGYGRDDGSYWKADPDDPSKQYHVHIYNTKSGIEVYSHHEFRVSYPVAHYRAVDYRTGETCDELEERADE